MTNISDFVNSKKELPKFLSKNKTLLSCKTVVKIFPKIGLLNCKESVDIIPEIPRSAAYLLERIKGEIRGRLCVRGIMNFPTAVWARLCNVVDAVCSNALVLFVNKKIFIGLKTDVVYLNETVFKSNTSIFKIYNKLKKDFAIFDITIAKLEHMPEFKEFSSENITGNMEIVFSSDGNEGLWDIATMSMRGIKSCQSWDAGHRRQLIGSILDPFVGIIYLASSKDKLGTKMIRRSLVRFVIERSSGKKCLMIDRMYPAADPPVLHKFISFLKKKTDNAFDVFYGPDSVTDDSKYYYPKSHIHKKLTVSTKSYMDTPLVFKDEIEVEDANQITDSINTLVYSRGRLRCGMPHLYADHFIDMVFKLKNQCKKKHPDLEHQDFIKTMALIYLRNEKKLIKTAAAKVTKNYNISYGNKITSKKVIEAFKPLQEDIRESIKGIYKNISCNKTQSLNLP